MIKKQLTVLIIALIAIISVIMSDCHNKLLSLNSNRHNGAQRIYTIGISRWLQSEWLRIIQPKNATKFSLVL
jgi:hypothetical protein